MVNEETAYTESGRRAGLAMNDKDTTKAGNENTHFRKMQSVESGLGKARAQALYQNAYRKARKSQCYIQLIFDSDEQSSKMTALR